MKLIPYFNLPGNAEEAMNFYRGVFGGQIEIMRWSEMPPDPRMPVSDALQNKVMHGSLSIRDDVTIFFTDSGEEGTSASDNRVYVHIEFDSEEELRKTFDALSAGGRVNMPVDRTFWGAVYGDLVDKFGVLWGLHYQLAE